MNRTAEASGQLDVESLMAQEEELRARLQMVERQLDLLSGMREEKQRAQATLVGLRDAVPGSEVLLPVGGATFIRAHLADNSTVLKGIGADYSTPRALNQAEAELKEEIGAIERDVQQMTQSARELEARHAQLVQLLQGAGGGGSSGVEAANAPRQA